MKFLKYRHKFSYCHHEWVYEIIPDYVFEENEDENLSDDDLLHEYGFLEDITDEYSYSDKYRGIDYEIVEHPPKEWILSKIRITENSISRGLDLIKELKKLLKEN